ncbi:DeoR/GlpR family DNA-binding transcription regulator [Anaerostipes sp.]|uniref:DeoR/GlpR family DNA-binding transcription regulator n=1 Tax=Anaerostipes sp. TaxID=1872530 RepID=UPI003FED9310
MYQEERLKKIMEWLEKEQVLSNQELMRRLEVSRDTARRDIVRLTENGSAVRTHGGIARVDFQTQVGNYQTRMTDNPDGKQRIAKVVAEILTEGSLCFFDTSTHMKFVCKELKKEISVYTHSLDNLGDLAQIPKVDVHCLGGRLNKNNRFFYGYEVWEALSQKRFDYVILGAAAVLKDGIYFEDEEDARIKQLAAKRGKQVIVLADYPKFQRESKYRAVEWDMIDLLITDRALSKEWEDRFLKEELRWQVV